MSWHSVAVAEVAVQAWRNGGGRTRELLAWPTPQDWTLRISVADIDADGPFSAYPGVERWFAVMAGAGVALGFAAAEKRLVGGDAPLRFDGAPAPHCRLLDGPSVDLNLMARHGEATMLCVDAGVAWRDEFAVRALFANVAGLFTSAGQSRHVAARTLSWTDANHGDDEWRFSADEPGPGAGWWLGHTPSGAHE